LSGARWFRRRLQLVGKGQSVWLAVEFGALRGGRPPRKQKRCLASRLSFSGGRYSCSRGNWDGGRSARRWSACLVPWINREDQLHGSAAFGTERRRIDWSGRGYPLGGAEQNGSSRVQLDAQPAGSGGGMTKAVVADGAQSGGQHVTQIAAHELDPGEGF